MWLWQYSSPVLIIWLYNASLLADQRNCLNKRTTSQMAPNIINNNNNSCPPVWRNWIETWPTTDEHRFHTCLYSRAVVFEEILAAPWLAESHAFRDCILQSAVKHGFTILHSSTTESLRPFDDGQPCVSIRFENKFDNNSEPTFLKGDIAFVYFSRRFLEVDDTVR